MLVISRHFGLAGDEVKGSKETVESANIDGWIVLRVREQEGKKDRHFKFQACFG